MLNLNISDDQLAQAPSEIRSGNYNQLNLDLALLGYIRPYQLVRIRCLIDLAIEQNLSVQINPPNSSDVRDYAGRMGLFKGTSYTYPYNENHSSTFFPLIKITNDRNESIYEECRKVFGLSNATANYVNRLSDAFVELADNIYFHSGETENSGWGYIHAQAYKHGGTIRLGLSDVGVGVYGSYQRTGQLRGRSEEQLTRDVFEELESSLNPGPKKGHRGLGLHEVKDFIDRHTGLLVMYTGNVIVNVNQVGIFPQKSSFKTEGTWIQMRVPIR